MFSPSPDSLKEIRQRGTTKKEKIRRDRQKRRVHRKAKSRKKGPRGEVWRNSSLSYGINARQTKALKKGRGGVASLSTNTPSKEAGKGKAKKKRSRE